MPLYAIILKKNVNKIKLESILTILVLTYAKHFEWAGVIGVKTFKSSRNVELLFNVETNNFR